MYYVIIDSITLEQVSNLTTNLLELELELELLEIQNPHLWYEIETIESIQDNKSNY